MDGLTTKAEQLEREDILILNTQKSVRLREMAANSIAKNEEDRLLYKLSVEDAELFKPGIVDVYEVRDGNLHFSDEKIRDQLAAEHYFYRDTREDLIEPISVALEILTQTGWRDRGAAGRYLALVQKQSDILTSAANAIEAASHRTFDVLDVVQSALPYIETPSIEGLISLCDAQYEQTKNDLLQGRFFNIFGDCYKGNLNLFRSIIEAVCDQLREPIASLYTMSVLRISETEPEEAIERIFKDVVTTNPVLKARAVSALGRLILLGRAPTSRLSVSADYLKKTAAELNEEIRLAAYLAIVEGALVYSPLVDTLNGLLANKNQDLLRTLAHVVSQRTDKAEANSNFNHWITTLSALSPHEEGAIENLDFILVTQMKKGRQEFVLSVLEAWILQNDGEMSKRKELTKLFGSTFHELLSDEATQSQLITSWLIRDEHQMLNAADAVLSELHLSKIHQIAFAPEIVRDFDKDGLKLLIRRMLGLVIHEEHLVSLSLSLLSIDEADKSLLPFVEDILKNEVGFNFPALTCGRLRELKTETTDKEIQAICDRVIESVNAYFDNLKDLPQIKELRPSKDLQAKIQKQQAKTMAVHQKAASEESIIQKLATHIPLKAGRANFSFHDGKLGEPFQLHSYEHSITLPRGYVLDAVGYELSLFGYRTSKRGQ